MVDHDIDALLIGSLYGELSSADEARLKAHLESHPADRAALEGLTHARDAVRASRIFEVQLEPPQSISALLIQEAARRAPRKIDADAGEGWFARLRRSFLMHPAMAAATMMVLVVGVAGTLYLRKGDHFAAPELAAPERAAELRSLDTAPTPTAPSAVPPASQGAGASDPAAAAAPTGQAQVAAEPAADSAAFGKGAQDPAKNDPIKNEPAQDAKDAKAKSERLDQATGAYRVGLADGEAGGGGAAQQAKPADVAPAMPSPPPAAPKPAEEKPNASRSAGPGALLEVTTPRPAPKELDDDDRPKKTAKARVQSDEPRTEAAPPADSSIGAKRGMAPVVRAPEAAPAAPAATAPPAMKMPAPAGGGAMGGAPATGGLADDRADAADADLAWARDQHSRLVSQVRAGRCTDAAGTAVALSSRAPGYYQQNVENDRAVKECLAYITAERERAAERTQRTGATRRLGGEEAPAAAPKQATRSKSAPAKPAATDKGKAAPAKAAPAATKTD